MWIARWRVQVPWAPGGCRVEGSRVVFKSAGCVMSRSLRAITVLTALAILGGCLHGGLPGRQQNISRTVNIDIKDRSFGAQSIPVRHGETVRFVISNRSAQAHDFAIGTPRKQRQRRHWLRTLYDAGMSGPDYYDLPEYDAINAVFLPPGETRELVWWFNRSATLEFASNVPGHYERGKKGVFDFDGAITEPRKAKQRRTRSLARARPVEKPEQPKRPVAPPPVESDLPADDDGSQQETDAPASTEYDAEPTPADDNTERAATEPPDAAVPSEELEQEEAPVLEEIIEPAETESSVDEAPPPGKAEERRADEVPEVSPDGGQDDGASESPAKNEAAAEDETPPSDDGR